jgi:hypothetical protein
LTGRFSRALYRDLVATVDDGRMGPIAKQDLLLAVESNIHRLATDPDFSRPERRLFLDVRMFFSLEELPRVRTIIERHVSVASPWFERARAEVAERIRPCRALARDGRNCARPAIQGMSYCPSHRHLEAELWVEASADASSAQSRQD